MAAYEGFGRLGPGPNLTFILPAICTAAAEFLLLIFFGAPTGHQLAFFMVHAAALLVQRLMRRVYPEGQAGESSLP